MPTIETVSIEDVYPWEDEYGNQILSRDYTAKANQDYVRQLADSMRRKGEPDEPPMLARDGGIYRIVSGNSRVMAMRELGTKRFSAVILDDDSARAAVETAVRTNTKKKYEAVEESRFVQQLTMFGADDYVAEVAGITVEQAARMRRAKAVVDDAAEDMTLTKLAAIGEFAGDDGAVAELTACPERELASTLAKLRSRRHRSEQERGTAAALAERGIEVVDEVSGYRTITVVGKPSDIPAELPERTVATRHNIPGFFILHAWAAPTEAPVDDEAERLAAERAAIAKRYRAGGARRMEWLAEHLAGVTVLEAFALTRERKLANASVRRFLAETGAELASVAIGPMEVIAAFMEANDSEWGICGYDCEPQPARCRTYVALLDAMRADGYEPDADETDIYDQAVGALAGKEQR